MALLKEKQTDFGIAASYWKVAMVTINRDTKECFITLNLYLEKGAQKFIESYAFSTIGKEGAFDKYFETDKYTDIYNAAYVFTKENEEYFIDAVNDEE